jgi:hypothetical protein
LMRRSSAWRGRILIAACSGIIRLLGVFHCNDNHEEA